MRFSILTLATILLTPVATYGQPREHDIQLKNWSAPTLWQTDRTADTREVNIPLVVLPTTQLLFVGMTPCRVIDTRVNAGIPAPFGPPSLQALVSKSYPIQSSATCSIPPTALAYSLNITVTPITTPGVNPPGYLGFLTVYPTGAAIPNASTLNNYLGTVVSNAAIVPAGDNNGSISAYAHDATDMIVDINGYYIQNAGTITSGGGDNTALGASALIANVSGNANTAVGSGALSSNTIGSNNAAIGDQALYVSNGNNNTASGFTALRNNSNGNNNTATGSGALEQNTTGSNNTVSGMNALDANSTDNNNTASGFEASASGSNNTAIGYKVNAAGNGTAVGYQANAQGSNGIAIGSGATALANTIAIGLNAGIVPINNGNIMIGNVGTMYDAKTIRIGDVHTQTFIAGISGVNISGVPVLVSSTGQLGVASSSRRYKEDIEDMGDATADLMRLRPVTFRYKQAFEDGTKPIQYGLIAEEVAEVYPELVAHSADGKIETVKYQVLDSMLLNEVQRQNAQNAAQQKKIELLEERLTRLEALLQEISH